MSKCREEFEKTYLGNGKQYAQRNEHGDYVSTLVQDAWFGWQAAWNARGKVDKDACDEQRDGTQETRGGINACLKAIEQEDEK